MSAVEELMKDVAAAQKSELRRINIESEVKHLVAARMAEGTAKSRVETRTWRWVSLGSAAAAVAAVVLVVVSLHRSPFLTFTIDAPTHFGQTGDLLAPPAGQAMAAVFSDGSRVVVGDSSHARIDSVDSNGATVTLDDGHLDATVIHRPQTRWLVRAGEYRIRVTGTRFSTAWSRRDQALTVRLYEGSVVVTGPGMAASGARVRAGRVLHATAQGATLAAAEPEARRRSCRSADTQAWRAGARAAALAPVVEAIDSVDPASAASRSGAGAGGARRPTALAPARAGSTGPGRRALGARAPRDRRAWRRRRAPPHRRRAGGIRAGCGAGAGPCFRAGPRAGRGAAAWRARADGDHLARARASRAVSSGADAGAGRGIRS